MKVWDSRQRGEIAKDVSAMANSLGGTIIFGVSTQSHDKEVPSAIEGIDSRNVESFERILNAHVRPPLRGIRKKLIPNAGPSVMVVEVPASDEPPHQSLYDCKYYRRSGTESLPMEHDVVALHFGRRTGPIVDLQVRVVAWNKNGFGFPKPHLRILLGNSGKRVARFVKAFMLFPPPTVAKVLPPLSGSWSDIDRLYPDRQARQIDIDHSVIHPSLTTSVVEFELDFCPTAKDEPDERRTLSWTIYADEMQPQSGQVLLEQIGEQQ